MVEPKVMLLEFHTVSVLYSPKVQPSIVSPLGGGAAIKGRRKRSHMQSFNINGSDGSKILKKRRGGGGGDALMGNFQNNIFLDRVSGTDTGFGKLRSISLC